MAKKTRQDTSTNTGNPHRHEWWVYGTARKQRWLMLRCSGCGAEGSVDDPSEEEWDEAYEAPSRPYRWPDEGRVHLRSKGHPLFGKMRQLINSMSELQRPEDLGAFLAAAPDVGTSPLPHLAWTLFAFLS